ncbi:hypothetical protein GXP70_00115 [Paenibacillus lycopersici]|uniref:Uncharacterized protein n=1 Tax=Paenibacillus lycopersici TaxID=2704462 RepID=A0A6C0FN24_9BACL|nr:hypothetical protein [Paenibacillus lycopersici]QHT58536.1 hypothetical protein GXP70_00115 [Paenibacillus lycopersici]
MKFMKTKVAAGVVAVGMLASMGTVFAATDAGGQLHNWYDKASSTIKGVITGEFATYKSGKIDEHNGKVATAIGKARQDIRDAGNAQIANVKSSVTSQTAAYGSQLDSAKGAILTSMPAEFDAFVSTENTKTDGDVAKAGAQNTTDINNAIKNHKGVYLGRLDTETAPTVDAKKAELRSKIDQVKQALNGALEGEKNQAAIDLQNHLKAQLDALETQLDALTQAGVNAAIDEINAKGQTVLNTALSELDNIVANEIDN